MLASSGEILNSPHCLAMTSGIEECNSLKTITPNTEYDKLTIKNRSQYTLINSKRSMVTGFESFSEYMKAISKASMASESCWLPDRAMPLEMYPHTEGFTAIDYAKKLLSTVL
jgi:hypothetical protein